MNPTYADVRYSSGREATVSIRDLAPNPHVVNNDAPNVDLPQESDAFFDISDARGEPDEHENDAKFDYSNSLVDTRENANRNVANPEYSVRRSARSNKGVPPSRYGVNYRYCFAGGVNDIYFIEFVLHGFEPVFVFSAITCFCKRIYSSKQTATLI